MAIRVTRPEYAHALECLALIEHGTGGSPGLHSLYPCDPLSTGTEPGVKTSVLDYAETRHAQSEVSIQVRHRKCFEVFSPLALHRLHGLQVGIQCPDGLNLSLALIRGDIHGPVLQRSPDPQRVWRGSRIVVLDLPTHYRRQTAWIGHFGIHWFYLKARHTEPIDR
ncbi:MAG: hypothetical protein OWU33_11605 [Firmicutes bacterium]|nr:hypothetical protein [Bacillota bacterium]